MNDKNNYTRMAANWHIQGPSPANMNSTICIFISFWDEMKYNSNKEKMLSIMAEQQRLILLEETGRRLDPMNGWMQ